MAKIYLPASDEKLLDECHIDSIRFRTSTTQSCCETAVRLRHLPTGIVVVCQQEDSRHLNKIICLKKLRLKVAELNKTPEMRTTTKIVRKNKEETKLFRAKILEKKKIRSKGKITKWVH